MIKSIHANARESVIGKEEANKKLEDLKEHFNREYEQLQENFDR